MKKTVLAFLLAFLVVPPVFAVTAAPHITDREIVEKLSKLEAGQTALQQQISDLKESTRGQINDLKESTNKRFDTLQWMLGLFITAAFSLMVIMGRVLWNQQIRLAQMETSLEAQKAEITFVKTLIEKLQTLIEKLIPPRGVL